MLAIGLQKLLLDMKRAGKPAGYPVAEFERMIAEDKDVSLEEAGTVTVAVVQTGIIKWDLSNNLFVL